MTSKKISQFTKQTTFDDADLINIVRNGTNFTVPFSAHVAALGVTGTINIVGGTGVAVLEQPSSTVNNIRTIENGKGIQAALSPSNGITLNHNFVNGAKGTGIIKDLTSIQTLFRSILAGSGISVSVIGDAISIAATGGAASNVFIVTSNHTTTGNELVSCNNTGSIIVTLNTSPANDERVLVKRRDGAVTVNGLIDGITNKVLNAQFDSLSLVFLTANAEWSII